MKYVVTLATVVVFITGTVTGQNLLKESFDYPAKDSLDGMGGWKSANVTSSKVAVTSPGLVFSGYGSPGKNNAVRFSNTGNGDLCSKYLTKIDTGSVYLSFLIRVDSMTPGSTSGYNIAMDQYGGPTNVNLRAHIQRVTDSTFNFGVMKFQSLVYKNTPYKTKHTYLVVLRYQFVPGAANDTARIYVFPDTVPLAEPAVPETLTAAGTDVADIGEIWLSNSFIQTGLKGSPVTIDEISVGTSWKNTITEPSATLLAEDFYYSPGDTLRGKNGWTVYYEGVPVAIDSFGLSYAGYHGSGLGRSIRLTGGSGGQTIVRTFPYTTDSVLFLSCMVNIKGTSAPDGFFISMTNDPGGNYRVPVYAKITAGKLQFGIRTTLSGTTIYDTTAYVPGKTYLLAVKYLIVPGTANDETSLFVFSSGIPSSEPPRASVGPLTMPNDNINVMGVALNTGAFQAGTALSGATVFVDGIRISTLPWRSGLTEVPKRKGHAAPGTFILRQNFPNPFNPSTTIQFHVVEESPIELKVYDMIGREVSTLVNEVKEPGTYSVHFDGSHQSSGIYFARLRSEGQIQLRKMILMR